VDNTHLIITGQSNDERMVASKMQQSLQLWHGLLKATGGDLVPDTCFWYLINFQYKKNHWKYKTWEDKTSNLQIPNQDGTMVTIPQLQANEACQTLGVCLAPNGNNEAEFQYMHGVATEWKNHMVTAKIPWAAADFGLQHVLFLKLCYPLLVTTFDKKQCDELLKPILLQGLPRIGVNRHLPRAMVHGLVAYQGLNIPNLHMEQMLLHVQTLVKYGSQMEDPMGLLIRANVELL